MCKKIDWSLFFFHSQQLFGILFVHAFSLRSHSFSLFIFHKLLAINSSAVCSMYGGMKQLSQNPEWNSWSNMCLILKITSLSCLFLCAYRVHRVNYLKLIWKKLLCVKTLNCCSTFLWNLILKWHRIPEYRQHVLWTCTVVWYLHCRTKPWLRLRQL